MQLVSVCHFHIVSNFVGDIPCDIITGGGRTAECLANSSMFGNYQDDFLCKFSS